ncbi:MAG: 6-O-methylguanine DNA methyltransferase, partial [Lactobacillus helsingborgensis]|nr:6-O-methylguanine DNA methyltransferase [Lactobacillus helsingborgensis]MCT6847767.1 6-O-methylguanine DNA methyltransferase [Lactobacillus helsingborgensis]
MTLYKTLYQSQLGSITLLSNQHYLLGLWFNDQKYFGADYHLTSVKSSVNKPIKLALNWLSAYFAGQNPDP